MLGPLLTPRVRVEVRGRTVQVARGGTGPTVLLIHGGWAGAEMHWGRVWQRMTSKYDVIAPDLPGLGAVDEPPLASVSDYASWLAELLAACAVERAICIGNSLGATLAWSLAGRFPSACSGLVLVDGFPMQKTPSVLVWLGKSAALRRFSYSIVERWIYNPAMLPRAFADMDHVPAEMRRAVREDWPLIVPRYVNILIAGDGAPTPPMAPLLLWGAQDRLPGSSARDAQRWQQRIAGSRLQMIEGAGHFPQVDAPDAFVDAVENFIRESAERQVA